MSWDSHIDWDWTRKKIIRGKLHLKCTRIELLKNTGDKMRSFPIDHITPIILGSEKLRAWEPWNFPGKSTGVGWHFLLQGIFPTQGMNPGLPQCKHTLILSEPPGELGFLDSSVGEEFAWVEMIPWRRERQPTPVFWTSLVAQMVKRLPTMRETRVWFLGWEDPLEKEMVTQSSTLAWKSSWTEKPRRLLHPWTRKELDTVSHYTSRQSINHG